MSQLSAGKRRAPSRFDEGNSSPTHKRTAVPSFQYTRAKFFTVPKRVGSTPESLKGSARQKTLTIGELAPTSGNPTKILQVKAAQCKHIGKSGYGGPGNIRNQSNPEEIPTMATVYTNRESSIDNTQTRISYDIVVGRSIPSF